MNTKPKKNPIDLPFTQLWSNLKIPNNNPKHPNKQNPKSKNHKDQSKQQHELFSTDLYPTKQRRSSLTYFCKRPQINERSSMMLLPYDKQNCQFNNNNTSVYVEQCNTSGAINTTNNYITHNNNSIKDEQQYRNNSLSSHNINKSKNKVTDQILQVVERNIIPFLVDKFIQSEGKMTRSVERLEEIINKQNQEIFKLKERQKVFQDVIAKMDRKIQGLDRLGSGKDRQDYQQQKQKYYRALEEKGKELNDYQKISRAKKAITQNNDQNEAGIQQISRLLQQLTLTMQKSANRNTQQIGNLQKQVKKISEKQKISQQKLQKQFASRILQLITTYNDNFVDLDKRITQIQLSKNQQNTFNSINRLPLGKIVSLTSDKQKTNRHE